MVASLLPLVELTCFEVVAGRVELRPAPKRRAWMDETPNSFAYRCVPLTVANTHGWEMLCPFTFDAVWDGGPGLDAVKITPAEPNTRPELVDLVTSHFGSGILTFNPLHVIRTAPGHGLWLAGPSNSFKDAIQPMAAVVETDWMPYTFSFSWKFTRAATPVRFERGEPFCLIFPIARGTVDACEPKLRPLTDSPELHDQYRWALARRQLDVSLAVDTREQFQAWYKDGAKPDGTDANVDEHRIVNKPKPFQR